MPMLNSLFGNWKTSLSGVVTALGLYFASLPEPGWKLLGQILTVAGPLFFGAVAKDASTGSKALPG